MQSGILIFITPTTKETDTPHGGGHSLIRAICIDYVTESATYGFLFTSCKTLENEQVSAANE